VRFLTFSSGHHPKTNIDSKINPSQAVYTHLDLISATNSDKTSGKKLKQKKGGQGHLFYNIIKSE
tara:strand:- start:707 stop:901 length:195 start_codon:yes stop_codon:yes gene_type:complete